MSSSQRLHFLEADPRAHGWPAGQPMRGTLLLIHGFPLTARMWEPQLEVAEHGWRVVAPYLRGFDGRSPRSIDAASMDDFAEDIAALLQTLAIPQAVVGGLSMGGYVSLALYRMAPALFSGLILADTRADTDSAATRLNRQRLIETVTESGPGAVADTLLPSLLGATTRNTQPALVAHVREMIASVTADPIIAATHAMMTRGDSLQTLPSIRVPTLVIVGEEDTLTPPDLSRAMASAVPGADLAMIPRAGHLSNLEQPQPFNGVLSNFLDRL